jgi:hypothetical protein
MFSWVTRWLAPTRRDVVYGRTALYGRRRHLEIRARGREVMHRLRMHGRTPELEAEFAAVMQDLDDLEMELFGPKTDEQEQG